jgi:two-component system, NarL family, response regulator LiaR
MLPGMEGTPAEPGVGERFGVLVVDDHILFADAVRARLRRDPQLDPVWVAYSAADARRLLIERAPAVAVLDVVLGDASGIDLVRFIAEQCPQTRAVMLTGVDSVELLVSAIAHGARAWLPKTVDAAHLVEVIKGVHRGEAWLSPRMLGETLTALVGRPTQVPDPLSTLTLRERTVLQCLVDGLNRPDIATRLHISANTVRTHTQNILHKLAAHSTLEAVAVALRHGMRTSGI